MRYDTQRSLFQPSISPTAARSIAVAAQNTTACAMARWAAWLDDSSFLAAHVRFAQIGTELIRREKLSRRATNHVRGYDASALSRALASFRSRVSKPSVNQL